MSARLLSVLHVLKRGCIAGALALALSPLVTLINPAIASASSALTHYSIPFGNVPGVITTDSNGAVWFAETLPSDRVHLFGTDEVVRMTPTGNFTQFPIPTILNFSEYGAAITDLTVGPDGAIWFVDNNTNQIERLASGGQITAYVAPSRFAYGDVTGLTSGPDGALWFTMPRSNIIGRITTTGSVTEYQLSSTVQYAIAPQRITSGPDGAVWFTESQNNKIGRITTTGSVTEYPVPTSNAGLNDITSGPDGALWFTEAGDGKIGRIATSGAVTEYSLPTSVIGVGSIASGSDGALWFATTTYDGALYGSNLGRITTSGTITEYPVIVPQTQPPSIADLASRSDNTLWLTYRDGNQLIHVDQSLLVVPSAPTNLTVPSPAQTPSLTWSAAANAASYNVYRNGTKIDSTTTTTYMDTTAPEGSDSYYVTAVNSGGESTPSTSVQVLVDRTAPTIQSSVTPVTDSSGYNTSNVVVSFTCGDNAGGSGIASCPSPVTVDNEGIGHLVDGTAVDNAGNRSTIHVNASLLVAAVNSGGDSAGHYSADAGFTGGAPYTSPAAVDTSSVTVMPAPQSVYQTVRFGTTFAYVFPGLTPNARYTLRLHFNELYWGTALAGGNGGVGSRVFNVAINGQSTLTNFDIFSAAGGANTAIVEELPVTADANGNIAVQFTSVTDNAMVNGIDLYQGSLPAEPPAPTPPTVTTVRINAGAAGTGTFVADTEFNGGTPYTSTADVDTSATTNPAPEAVYQSARYGNFSYLVTNLTPGATFQVRLHFNELYWGTALASGNGGVGNRVFNVAINGTPVLNNFDIYATAGGANKALTEDFTATADAHGRITIQFTTVTDNALVNGIEIVEQ